jgi:hypothetical protein
MRFDAGMRDHLHLKLLPIEKHHRPAATFSQKLSIAAAIAVMLAAVVAA